MACDSLADFKELAKYRKSFNGDLQTSKARPVKMVVLEAFKFEKDQKATALVLGAVPTELMNQLKENAGKVKAVGTLALGDQGLTLTVKSGKLADGDVRKALEFAQVKRAFTVVAAGEERAADADEDVALPAKEQPVPGKLADAGSAVEEAIRDLEAFFVERAAAMRWHEAEIKTQQDAARKIDEINAVVQGLNERIAASEAKARELARELKDLRKDAQVAKYSKAQLTKLDKAIEAQRTLAEKLGRQIETQNRKLPELELLARKHGASRHGPQTDLSLQARRAATGGITPDQKDNVHGVSEARVGKNEGVEAPLTELTWRSTKIRIEGGEGGPRRVVNSTEVVKALLGEMDKLDKVDTTTASKFHSPELEREAVQRAIALVERQCQWSEILEGEVWKPLDSVTVYVGPPRGAPGWGVSMSKRAPDKKMALLAANKVIEQFRRGDLDQEALLEQLDVTLHTVTDKDGNESVPMVKSARVTLGRTSKGWTSITHFPDTTATPPGWQIGGRKVRKDARSQPQSAPSGSAP